MTQPLNKYQTNQTIFIVTLAIIGYIFYALTTSYIAPYIYPIFFVTIAICQHYFLNLVHIASHHLMSKNRIWNSFFGNIASIIGGVTFADFKTTHFLHHRNVSDEQKDPDHWITTSGNIFTIPFKIFYHDVYFWSRGLWKQNHAWRGYLVDRFTQVSLILAFQFSGKIDVWINFWLLPLLCVGFLNGLFLFYFPHYTTKIERSWRALEHKLFFQSMTLLAIDISRIYHEKHHDRINNNANYFPVLSYIQDKLAGNWTHDDSTELSKYTDIKQRSAA